MGIKFNLAGASFTTGKVIRQDMRLGEGSLALLDFTHSGTAISAYAAASGSFTFAAQPTAGDTITLNGTVVTFVASGAAGNQVNIGADLSATMTALAAFLNASADAQISLCTYAAQNSGSNRLGVYYKSSGILGNSFTLASSSGNAVRTAATLKGGTTPANGAAVTNLAAEEAKKIGGSLATLTQAQADFVVSRSGAGSTNGTGAVYQRSSKGSLVGVLSKLSSTGSIRFQLSDTIAEYMRVNSSRTYAYRAVSNYLNNNTTNSNAMETGVNNVTTAPSNYLFSRQEWNTGPGEVVQSNNKTWSGTVPTSLANMQRDIYCFGGSSAYGSLGSLAHVSKVFRSIHVIDVTEWTAKTGKTYTQWAAEQAAIEATLFATGGRWFGDTWEITPTNLA